MAKRIQIEKYHNILLPRFDTFGDIVLLQGFIKALLDLLPEASITLLVRDGYEQLKELFPERLNWKTVRIINPHKGDADLTEVRTLLEKLDGDSYDLILFTTYDHTWADDTVAAKLASALRVALGESRDIQDSLLRILRELGTESPSCPYDEFVSVKDKIPETEKYQLLWELLGDKDELLPAPHLSISKDTGKSADEILEALDLTEGSFIFCFPGGTANVSHKFWPEENFAEIIAHLEKKFDLKTLVLGHESEKDAIKKVVGLAGKKGADPKSWLGKDGDIPLVCGLAKKSLFYLGNDTGPMHMAAALGKPVIAIFGGGHWPRFIPCAKVGRVFFSPLPCFNCGWNCVFGEALCMSSLPLDATIGAIKIIVEEIMRGKGDYKTVEIKPDRQQQYAMIDKAVDCLRRSETEIELFKAQVKGLFERIEKCELDRDERLKTIQDIGLKLDSAEAERDARMKVINHQQKEFSKKIEVIENDRLNRLEAIRQLGVMLDSAKAQSKARMEVIERQEKEYTERIREIEDDREARLQVIERQEKEYSKKIEEIEEDRVARLEVIKALGKQNEDKAQKISELQGFDIRRLGFKGACSYFTRKLVRGLLRTQRR